MKNDALIDQVLSTWTAIEVLSPAKTYKSPDEIGRSDFGKTIRLPANLPWPDSSQPISNDDYVYGSHVVVLGTLDAAPAYNEIFKTYPNENLNIRTENGIIPIALLTLDHQGRLSSAAEPTISSFAWGVPLALRKDLKSLSEWVKAEAEMLKKFAEILAANGGVVNQEKISALLEYLMEHLAIPASLCRPDIFVVSYPFSPAWKDRQAAMPTQKPPSPILLNSFYLADLIDMHTRPIKKRPANVLRYIGGLKPSAKTTDFTASRTAIQRHFQPKHIPLGRWPAGPGRGLVTMQQLAANCIITHDDPGADAGEAIVAVNGPPGTGKTTLFRDVIADIICSRASAMVSIVDPAAAFKASPYRWMQGGFDSKITPIPEELRGYEIIVASSNNGAVENITRELPGIKAIPEQSGLRYYAQTGSIVAKTESWGMIAAALGNMKNCNTFTQAFWWNQDWSIRQALNCADGKPKKVPDKDANGKPIERMPYILDTDDVASNPAEARSRWQQARARFTLVKATLSRRLELISELATLMSSIPKFEVSLQNERLSLELVERDLEEAKSALLEALKERLTVMTTRSRAQERMDALKLIAPGMLKRILKSAAAKDFDTDMEAAVADFTAASRTLDSYDQKVIACQTSVDAMEQQTKLSKARINKIEEDLLKLKSSLTTSRKNFPGIALDAEFLDTEHSDFHAATPWLDDQTNQLREDLFAAAMDVHRAFCQAAAKVLRPNLKAAMDVIINQRPAKDVPDIVQIAWQSLFLVCPVISTAFASVSRLFKHVPDGTFGHLLVDEAGQAAPQYAVGAMAKAKSVYIVGDPLQIEPVVSLPEPIGVQIAQANELETPLLYLAPRASVQTLGDRASAFKGSFEGDDGVREVGLPLVVHRRCSEPMFSIANQIAYAGTMVSLKKPQPSPIKDVLHDSKWIDVSGSPGKWVPEEGKVAVELLKRLQRAGVELNLYVLTPFREVSQGMRAYIRQALHGTMTDDVLERFVEERVGTIHTAQGKEADAVLFVLGASGPDAAGSRNWASSAPNLLNVAVTRAKEALYVIGDYNGWSGTKHFDTMASVLPRVDADAF